MEGRAPSRPRYRRRQRQRGRLLSSRNKKIALILIAVILILVFVLTRKHFPKGEQSWPPSREAVETVPRPLISRLPDLPHISVYFNGNQAAVYRESYRNIWRHGDDLEEIIVAEIDRAKSSIDIAVQELNLPLVAEALCDKHVEGVNVRLILENRYSYVPSMLKSGSEQAYTCPAPFP